MHRARRVVTLALISLIAMLCLSGCLRVDAAFAISQGDLVSGELIIAAVPAKAGDTGPVLTVPPSLRDVVHTEKYEADGYVGQKVTFSQLSFSDLSLLAGSITTERQYRLSVRRSGDLVSMAGSVDLSDLPADKADVQIKMAFPGTIARTNGVNQDGTISWTPKLGAVTELSAVAQYTDSSGTSWTKWVAVVAVLACLVAAAVVALALIAHRRSLNQQNAPTD